VTISREPYVRPRFVGALCLLCLVPIYLTGVIVPDSFWYTAGIAVPFSYFTYRCLFSGAQRFTGMISLSAYRVLYLGSFAIAVAIHFAAKVEWAISWYISGAAFLCGESVTQDVLAAFGLGTRYSFDRDE